MLPISQYEYVHYETALENLKTVNQCYQKDQIERLYLSSDGKIIKNPIEEKIDHLSKEIWMQQSDNLKALQLSVAIVNTMHKKLSERDLTKVRSGDLTQLAANKYNNCLKVINSWNKAIGQIYPDLMIELLKMDQATLEAQMIAFSFKEMTEGDIALKQYFELLDKYSSLKRTGELNDYTLGAYQISYESEEIKRISQLVYDRLIQKGMSPVTAEAWSRPGIIAEDQFWIWIRDAVTSPTGFQHMYNRLVWKSFLTGVGGAAVMPILDFSNKEAKISLNLAFRHATSSWEFEMPRGGSKVGETKEETAKRELKEETGFSCEHPLFIGNMTPDSGLTSSIVPIFTGRVQVEEKPKYDKTEAIAGKYTFTTEQIEQGLINGYLEIEHKGSKKQIPLRDPFLTYAYLIAKLKNVF